MINRSTETFYTHFTTSHHTQNTYSYYGFSCIGRIVVVVVVKYRRKVNGRGMGKEWARNGSNTINLNLVCKSRKLNRGKVKRCGVLCCVNHATSHQESDNDLCGCVACASTTIWFFGVCFVFVAVFVSVGMAN